VNGGGWRRLHPISPLVRAGRGAIALAVLLVPELIGGRSLSGSVVQLGILAAVVVFGALSWLVTRWRLDGGDLQIESGLVRRQSLRFPLAQVQAIDIVQPGLARIFGVAELRLRMAGASGGTARLAYVGRHEAEPLRAQLLALAGGRHQDPAPVAAEPERILSAVASGQLAASILISGEGILAEALLAGLVTAAIVSPAALGAVAGGGAAWIITVPTLIWRRFNQEFRLTVAEAPDGLRLRSGLVALTAETIRPGRVQAVRMVEPLVWRALGWCRLEVDIAGRQRRKGEGQAQRGQLRAVLPVGSPELALALLERILPGTPQIRDPPPRRARLKSPLRYHFLAWGRSDSSVVATSGRLRRVTVWVPLAKVQSLRRVQGPVQRRLALASVHLDVAGRGVHAILRDRDAAEADRALSELVVLCRRARAAPSDGVDAPGGEAPEAPTATPGSCPSGQAGERRSESGPHGPGPRLPDPRAPENL
jgi:putative membrane protein